MLLDIGVGIILGLWVGPYASTSANVVLGILFTLLPDVDLLVYFLLKKTKFLGLHKRLRDHREIFHYPLLYLILGSLIVLAIDPNLVALFVAGSFIQFAHDSIGVGWGIPWLYPFSSKYFKFMYQYDLHRAGLPQKLIWIWSKQEQNQLIDSYGDQEWHKHTFQIAKYAPTWHLIELTVFIIALIALTLH